LAASAAACREAPSEPPWCRRQVPCLDAGSPSAPLPSPSCNAARSECRSRHRYSRILINLVVGVVGFCPPRAARPRSMLSCPLHTPARLRSPWPPAHGRPAATWVTPCPSSRALSRRPCRGARRAPSRRPCRAEGSTLLASESDDSTEGQAPQGGRRCLPHPSSPSVRRDRCSQPRYAFSSPRYAISSLAAAAPARFAPMVEAEGP
jgi:hypothetical protein